MTQQEDKMARETTLRKLLIDELRDAYHAEKQLTKALPKLAKAATATSYRRLSNRISTKPKVT